MFTTRNFASVGALLLLCQLVVAQSSPPAKVTLHIEEQPVSTALEQFANQTGLQLVFRDEGVPMERWRAPRIVGSLTPNEALIRLLSNTELKFEFVNDRTVRIAPARTSAQTTSQSSDGKEATGMTLAQSAGTAGSGIEESRRKGGEAANKGSEGSGPSGNESLQEIVVTAQKREERLQDVPVPVSALKAEDLVQRGQLRLQDYFSSVPGMTVVPANQSSQAVTIRGIPTQASILIDDSPYNASAQFGGGAQLPDIDPGELARIEVLRGPQGTLYGASSMGGIVKFVTIDPSIAGFSGNATAGVSSVRNGANAGYNARVSVNVPVSDDFALRASGFTHQDPGYIDNPFLGIRGVNEQRVSGGRLSGIWRPSSAVSLKLNALYQRTSGDAANDILNRNGLGDLQQDYIRGVGPYARKAQAYGATLTADLGRVQLVAISGYNINEISDSFDFSYALGGISDALFPGFSGAPVFNDIRSKKFTQEVRLSGGSDRSVEWLAGAFYTHEKSHFEQNVFASDPLSGAVAGKWLTLLDPTSYQDSAAFAALTWHLTERFATQFGGRQSWIEQTAQETFAGTVRPEANTTDSVFTYLVTPTFKVNPNAMLYARVATGYRAGGPNLTPIGIPEKTSPDTTRNYELGYKASFFGRIVTIDASVFRIDWDDIQTAGGVNPATGLTYAVNAGRARSEGVEFALEVRPSPRTSVAGWLTLGGRAKLLENSPSGQNGLKDDIVGLSGTDVSFNLGVDRAFPLSNGWRAFVGGMLSYVGERRNDPTSNRYPAYTKIDVHTGLRLQSWTANLYVNNVSDERGMIGGGPGTFPPFGFYYILPRVIGVNLSKEF